MCSKDALANLVYLCRLPPMHNVIIHELAEIESVIMEEHILGWC
jgi:hypothetical protein